MAKILMAAFTSPDQADQAIYELETLGYSPKDLSVISRDSSYQPQHSTGSEVASGAAAGATTGGAIGGLAGLVAGIGLMPALAGLFIGGPIAAAIGLTGAAATTVAGAVTGVAAGGLIGALTKLGLSRTTAESYDHIVKDGGIIIGLAHRDDITDESRAILERHGAQDVSLIDASAEDVSRVSESDAATSARMTRPEPAFGEYATTEVEDDLV